MAYSRFRSHGLAGKSINRNSDMMYRHTARIAGRVALVLFCMLALSSCSTVGSVLNYLVSLPLNLINAVCP